MLDRPLHVILLPGGVMPAGPAYEALLAELGPGVDARAKELEVYAAEEPPPDYSLATEVAGITRVADDAGFDRFHLVGYSAGGASSLAFAASHPERLLSLAILEPAFAGWQEMSDAERSHMELFRPLLDQDGPAMLTDFRRLQIAPDADDVPQPPGPPPPWMAKRPAGLHAILRAFYASDLDLGALRRFDRPVLFALGGRSHPDYYALMAERLARVFPDFTVEMFPHRHHFDPPHRVEPARVAALLRSLWTRGRHSGP
jgi:pimeloyl-ACP methyl ester carboxylesterase